MKRIHVLPFFFLLFIACSTTPDGPYFGNGFHNGWADQNSIVIWTRLTENPELNAEGTAFIIPEWKEIREMEKSDDTSQFYSSQIPDGLSLNEMEGACPGAAGEVELTWHLLGREDEIQSTGWSAVNVDKNFTKQWELNDLAPDSKYIVSINARPNGSNKISDTIKGTFRTPPTAAQESDIEFCVVTCHDYIRKDAPNGHKIYKHMLQMFPDFLVHTGDIEYYDKAAPYALTEELMRFKWDRLFALPLQRTFYTQVTTYFEKDDHDALRDDCYPGTSFGTVSFERGLQLFDDEQFPSHKTHYKTVRWGKDLQIWLVEGRNYRSPNNIPDGPNKTIWGQKQKEWFFKTVQASDATFKVLVSPAPLLGPDRDAKNDNYSNKTYQYEGDEIREFINNQKNFYICNGDRHWQYVTHWQDTHLWEFSCGAGSDVHAGGWHQEDKRPQHRFLRVKGGFLYVHVGRENGTPQIEFIHYDVDGQPVHREAFTQR